MTDGEPVKARPSWLQVLHLQGARGGLLALACGALLLPSVWPALMPLLRYERTALTNDQWWRWITAHLVHLDAGHALLNAIGLILLWTLFAGRLRGRADRAAWPATVLFAAKLAWEHWQGPLPFETQTQVVSAAHLYGAVGGLLAALPEATGAAILRRCKPEVSH